VTWKQKIIKHSQPYVSKGWSKDGQVDFMFCEYMRRSDVEGENIQQVRVV
jgi:transposase